MQTVGTFTFAKDADGELYSPQRLIAWLELQYVRHSEIEDKHAADMLRWLSDKQITDADRWRWMREQLTSKDTMVKAQAMLWNHSSRKDLDKAIDSEIRAEHAWPRPAASGNPATARCDGQMNGEAK